MIVPDHWAEARLRRRSQGRQITVRRWGWSMTSVADAQQMADGRAEAAWQRLLSGEALARREPKVPYNGADGVPIREEVLSRHGEQVITRNAYGAHCLNSPDVCFADIDFGGDVTWRATLGVVAALAVLSVGVGWLVASRTVTVVLCLLAFALSGMVARWVSRAMLAARGGAESLVRQRVSGFVTRLPDWGVRLYRTPAGFRAMATHRPVVVDAPEVTAFFKALAADPVYVRMCRHQRCFRARLTAKPWRMGSDQPARMRLGAWPPLPDRMAVRHAWVA